MGPAAFARAVAGVVERDDLVVNEALTTGRSLRAVIGPRTPSTWLAHRGSALGWGLPAAVGAALADPGRRVLALQGDGSFVFGAPALWTAAHEGLPLALVVADNGGYEILRAGLEGMTGRPEGDWPGLALREPSLDVAAICRGFGAPAARADRAADLPEALHDLWPRARRGPRGSGGGRHGPHPCGGVSHPGGLGSAVAADPPPEDPADPHPCPRPARRAPDRRAGVRALAACGGDGDGDAGTTAADCSPAALPLVSAGKLTVGTNDPALPPYFEGGDPFNGRGFEAAMAYAIADALGFSQGQVTWAVVPFDDSFAPGPKKFDFDINQIAITRTRAKQVDFSTPYYATPQAVVVGRGSRYARATTFGELSDARFGVRRGTAGLDAVNEVIAPTVRRASTATPATWSEP